MKNTESKFSLIYLVCVFVVWKEVLSNFFNITGMWYKFGLIDLTAQEASLPEWYQK